MIWKFHVINMKCFVIVKEYCAFPMEILVNISENSIYQPLKSDPMETNILQQSLEVIREVIICVLSIRGSIATVLKVLTCKL